MEKTGQLHAPASLPHAVKNPGTDWGAADSVWTFWRIEKSLIALPGLEPRTVQAVA